MTRRDLLHSATALLGGGLLGTAGLRSLFPSTSSAAPSPVPPDLRYQIGACDWSLGRRGRLDVLARDLLRGRTARLRRCLPLGGVQISFGPSPDNMHLFEESTQQAYREASERYDVAISGLALGALNNVPYKSSPRAEQWVRDSIDVAQALDVEVVLLAFFGNGDIKGDRDAQDAVIDRLKAVAPKAEEAGVVLGIESLLSAEAHMRILDAVGSDHVQVYYDVANSLKQGYDIYEEIRTLGRERICELHAKENGFLLGEGRVDFERVRAALHDIDYSGWIQIESAVPSDKEIFESYVSNTAFLRSLLYAAE